MKEEDQSLFRKPSKEDCWAVIPARGGSKGVPNKNVKRFGDKPLIAHSILALQASDCFGKIVVSSDSQAILEVASQFGAEAYQRSDPEESNDVVMPDIPVLSFIESLEDTARPTYLFMVQCTAPFIEPSTYAKASEILGHNPESTIFAAHLAHYFLWEQNGEETDWTPINHPFHERVGRQFAKTTQVNETGAFYGFKTALFLEARHRFFNNAIPAMLEDRECIDINDMSDWNYASFVLSSS